MEVFLTPELEKYIAEKVDSGLYNSESEVVREALRALIMQEKANFKRAKECYDFMHHAPNKIWTDEPTFAAEKLLKLLFKDDDKKEEQP